MPDKKPDIKRSLDLAWTWLGSAVAGASVLIGFFVRSGQTSIFPSSEVGGIQDDVAVSVAYWGLLVSAGGLAVLGALACRYASKGYGDDGFAWPRFTIVEHDVRDSLVAVASLVILALLPLVLLVMSTVVYSKSQIALWNAHVPLADGFLSSRWAAVGTICMNQPCFRMHPLDGVKPYAMQWFTYLNEPLALALLAYAQYVWLRWAMAFRRPKRR